MNEIISSMIDRRSVRNFKEDLPGHEAVQEIIEAGLYAASGMGRQRFPEKKDGYFSFHNEKSRA